MGMDQDPRVQKAVDHLLSQVQENGWRCSAAPELGDFHGPGRREDPCPIANVYALKVLALLPEGVNSETAQQGTDTLLSHWKQQRARKMYLFGI